MEQAQALAIVRSLANGVDPESGEVFPCQEGNGTFLVHGQVTRVHGFPVRKEPCLN